MKISTAFMFLIIVSGIILVYSEMTREANEQFGTYGTYINSSEWETKYDYVDRLNSTLAPLQEKFEVISDPEKGFFSKLVSGIYAIPYAVILVPSAVFQGVSMAGSMTLGFLTALGLPTKILLVATLLIFAWSVFKLLEYFQRSPL